MMAEIGVDPGTDDYAVLNMHDAQTDHRVSVCRMKTLVSAGFIQPGSDHVSIMTWGPSRFHRSISLSEARMLRIMLNEMNLEDRNQG